MGQKVGVLTFRVGREGTWKSKWFSDKNYALALSQDYSIRQYLTNLFTSLRCPTSDLLIIRNHNKPILIETTVFLSLENKYKVNFFNNIYKRFDKNIKNIKFFLLKKIGRQSKYSIVQLAQKQWISNQTLIFQFRKKLFVSSCKINIFFCLFYSSKYKCINYFNFFFFNKLYVFFLQHKHCSNFFSLCTRSFSIVPHQTNSFISRVMVRRYSSFSKCIPTSNSTLVQNYSILNRILLKFLLVQRFKSNSYITQRVFRKLFVYLLRHVNTTIFFYKHTLSSKKKKILSLGYFYLLSINKKNKLNTKILFNLFREVVLVQMYISQLLFLKNIISKLVFYLDLNKKNNLSCPYLDAVQSKVLRTCNIKRRALSPYLFGKRMVQVSYAAETFLSSYLKQPVLFVPSYYFGVTPPLKSAKLLCEWIMFELEKGMPMVEVMRQVRRWTQLEFTKALRNQMQSSATKQRDLLVKNSFFKKKYISNASEKYFFLLSDTDKCLNKNYSTPHIKKRVRRILNFTVSGSRSLPYYQRKYTRLIKLLHFLRSTKQFKLFKRAYLKLQLISVLILKKQLSLPLLNVFYLEGVKISLCGRTRKKMMAGVEWYRRGRVPCSTLDAQIDFYHSAAHTKNGSIGIKVWLYYKKNYNLSTPIPRFKK